MSMRISFVGNLALAAVPVLAIVFSSLVDVARFA